MKLYKYVGPDLLTRALTDDGAVCLKFDHPKNYNDPLELFLTLRGEESDPQVIAYYRTILGEIPQLPTTCFSKRPDVIPMWAHYGAEHAGFVLEIDEEALCDNISIGYVEDVEYVDETGAADWYSIRYAATTLKPRHTYFAQTAAFKSAYFTKNRCWEYELERRLVVNPEDFPDQNKMLLLKLPSECLSGIISGVRADDDQKRKLRQTAKEFACSYYEMRIGRSSCTPFFSDDAGHAFVFDDSEIEKAEHVCDGCSEPIENREAECCQWCTINEDDERDAFLSNPFTLIDHLGLREQSGYGFTFAGLKQVGKSTRDNA
ncbi:MAG: DUF2971 domain-containing protein [Planctomycetes bacterium]|nr:DUF2971 domain-containing protein [Planctomycetota bacterium]